MKKIIAIIILLCTAVFALAACSGGETPAAAWADSETLVYEITDKNTAAVLGDMTVVTERSPSDKTLGGQEYSAADGRMSVEIKLKDGKEITTVMLMTKYSVLATSKTYKDSADASESYVLNSRHSGKYYYYSYDGGEEKRIKTGAANYTDSEFLYHYIRSYPLTSPPSSLKIADPATDSVINLTCMTYGNNVVSVPFPSSDGKIDVKEVNCMAVAVSLADAPKGKAISVWYTPDSKEYYVEGISISPSKKIPVKIEENDVVYTISSITVR